MTRTAPGRQPGGTWPAGASSLGYIQTGDLPMFRGVEDHAARLPAHVRISPAPELRRAELERLAAVRDRQAAMLGLTQQLPTTASAGATIVEPRSGPPVITLVIVLTSAELVGERWDGYIREIRTSLDIHATGHHETHSCGSEGTRRAVWYVEVKAGSMQELYEDIRYHAGYLGARGRLTWAPCSPVDL